jgi:hypothetical protein
MPFVGPAPATPRSTTTATARRSGGSRRAMRDARADQKVGRPVPLAFMGYNPFRPKVAHRGDSWIVVATVLLVIVLVLWAIGTL